MLLLLFDIAGSTKCLGIILCTWSIWMEPIVMIIHVVQLLPCVRLQTQTLLAILVLPTQPPGSSISLVRSTVHVGSCATFSMLLSFISLHFPDGVLMLEYDSSTECDSTGGSYVKSVVKFHCAEGSTDLVRLSCCQFFLWWALIYWTLRYHEFFPCSQPINLQDASLHWILHTMYD